MKFTANTKDRWFEARCDERGWSAGRCWSVGEALERTLRWIAMPRERVVPQVLIYEVEGSGGSASMTAILRVEDKDGYAAIGPVS